MSSVGGKIAGQSATVFSACACFTTRVKRAIMPPSYPRNERERETLSDAESRRAVQGGTDKASPLAREHSGKTDGHAPLPRKREAPPVRGKQSGTAKQRFVFVSEDEALFWVKEEDAFHVSGELRSGKH